MISAMSFRLQRSLRKADHRLRQSGDYPAILVGVFGLAGDVDAETSASGARRDVADAVADGEPVAHVDGLQPFDVGVGVARVDVAGRQRNPVRQPPGFAVLEAP